MPETTLEMHKQSKNCNRQVKIYLFLGTSYRIFSLLV